MYSGGFRLGNKIGKTPEGHGFELDYDNYGKRQPRKFASSEEWWNSYSDLARDEWEKFPLQHDLLEKVNGDHRIAWVIAHFVGVNYDGWLVRENIDGLGGYSPKECLETSWGLKRLRMLFLQMAG